MKTWEEMTKLETKTKIMITFHIIMAIFSIITTIVNKESTWILVALLWINVAIMEYCDSKLLKGKDALIELQEEHTKIQDEMIMNLLKDLSMPNVVIDINLIKIPKHFTKPRKSKLNKRIDFYNKNKYFEAPIIIDPSNTLIDGYTSYLVAKKYNLKTVQAKVKIGGK
ncbi:MAG: hypothetical protein HFJ17_04530 [Clostridia bacterium]|nr:hypothetical protein [Clostridia bacterium]MCI9063848.1 hypothetical protein [Clostridia bacterium]